MIKVERGGFGEPLSLVSDRHPLLGCPERGDGSDSSADSCPAGSGRRHGVFPGVARSFHAVARAERPSRCHSGLVLEILRAMAIVVDHHLHRALVSQRLPLETELLAHPGV